ncbi:unnamed protein product [Cylindrotheca closterium]|uniref:Uncharacterized protein n=1 Tax=Cylindrotheca closterium TaxID=2856 RepID=A0AAD2FER8_9STRA|nr:unnamed protein product [Cylindrotheca closterium]
MPGPKLNTLSIDRPSLLTLNPDVAEDFDKAMIPDELLDELKSNSSAEKVAMVHIPDFGFLYVATNGQVHQFDPNLLEVVSQDFQIQTQPKHKDDKGSAVDIVLELDEAGVIKPGTNVLFRFGPKSAESIAQAKTVASQLQGLLGCRDIQLIE